NHQDRMSFALGRAHLSNAKRAGGNAGLNQLVSLGQRIILAVADTDIDRPNVELAVAARLDRPVNRRIDALERAYRGVGRRDLLCAARHTFLRVIQTEYLPAGRALWPLGESRVRCADSGEADESQK